MWAYTDFEPTSKYTWREREITAMGLSWFLLTHLSGSYIRYVCGTYATSCWQSTAILTITALGEAIVCLERTHSDILLTAPIPLKVYRRSSHKLSRSS